MLADVIVFVVGLYATPIFTISDYLDLAHDVHQPRDNKIRKMRDRGNKWIEQLTAKVSLKKIKRGIQSFTFPFHSIN